MSNQKIKFKGALRNFLFAPFSLIIILIALNICFYFIDRQAGIGISLFIGMYTIIITIDYVRNKPRLVTELVNFAMQYGTVQRKLINQFEIAYALVDYNGKLLWVNEQFENMTGKDKNYHKSITSIFPSISKELLQSEDKMELTLQLDDKYLRASMSRIYFDSMLNQTDLVEIESDQNLAYIVDAIKYVAGVGGQ